MTGITITLTTALSLLGLAIAFFYMKKVTSIPLDLGLEEKDAKRLFPEDKWNKLHLQIIFYGREYSPARSWKKEDDPIFQTIGRKSLA